MAQLIKLSREKRKPKITQKELAEKCGWGKSRICDYERDVKSPGVDSCNKMLTAFSELGVNVTFSQVFPPSDNEEASQ